MKIFHVYKLLDLFIFLIKTHYSILVQSNMCEHWLIQDSCTILYIIRGNLSFSEFFRINPWPIKHPKSLFLAPFSCILDDSESTPSRPKQGSYEPPSSVFGQEGKRIPAYPSRNGK